MQVILGGEHTILIWECQKKGEFFLCFEQKIPIIFIELVSLVDFFFLLFLFSWFVRFRKRQKKGGEK